MPDLRHPREEREAQVHAAGKTEVDRRMQERHLARLVMAGPLAGRTFAERHVSVP